jgi:hypothetical protein
VAGGCASIDHEVTHFAGFSADNVELFPLYLLSRGRVHRQVEDASGVPTSIPQRPAPHSGWLPRCPGPASRQNRGLLPHISPPLLAIFTLVAGIAAGPAPAAAEKLRSTRDLDGIHLALGPVGSAVHTGGSWDGAFGGEISLTRVTERRPLAAIGLGIGGARFSERAAGRLWAELSVATRRPLDVPIGLSVGPTAEVDQVIPPRWGAQATLWVYAGVIPYLRVGGVEKSGRFVELGLKIPLPAIRW